MHPAFCSVGDFVGAFEGVAVGILPIRVRVRSGLGFYVQRGRGRQGVWGLVGAFVGALVGALVGLVAALAMQIRHLPPD
jgi:hypothetical protein